MTNPSKPVPVGTPPPSPPPPGPRHPVPTGPGPGRYIDDVFALAESLGFQDLGHRGPQGVRPLVAADSEGRAGSTPPGAVPFTLPPTPGPPRFDDPATAPRPKPAGPTGPVPHPPPPGAA